MSKPTRASGKAEVNRRNFLARGAAAGVGAVAIAGAGTQDAAAQNGSGGIRWDYVADVVVIGAGVAGLPAAITARDHGASVIVVEENFDIGGRGMLSGGRVQLGGGHALQKKFNIKDSPDQVFADWVRARRRREPLQRPRPGPRSSPTRYVPTFQFLLDNGVDVHREADRHAGRLDRAAHLRHPRMAHPERGDRAAAQPQRLGPGSPPRRKRAQEGRADPAQARDDARSSASSTRRAGCSASWSSRRQQHREHRGQQGRRHRDRRPHRQRQLPPHVRSAADRGIPAGRPALRRSRAPTASSPRWRSARRSGRPAPRPARSAPAITKTRHIGCRWGYLSPGLRDRQPDLPSRQGDRPDGDGLAGRDPGQPVRQAVLERARQLLRLLQRRDGATTATRPS